MALFGFFLCGATWMHLCYAAQVLLCGIIAWALLCSTAWVLLYHTHVVPYGCFYVTLSWVLHIRGTSFNTSAIEYGCFWVPQSTRLLSRLSSCIKGSAFWDPFFSTSSPVFLVFPTSTCSIYFVRLALLHGTVSVHLHRITKPAQFSLLLTATNSPLGLSSLSLHSHSVKHVYIHNTHWVECTSFTPF